MSNTPKREISIPSRISVSSQTQWRRNQRPPTVNEFNQIVLLSLFLRLSFCDLHSMPHNLFLISIRIETNLLTYDANFRFRLDVLPCPFANILFYRTTFLVGCLMTRGLSLRGTSQTIETVLVVVVVAVDAENGPND